jgi:NADPH2 dehydrogenase
MSARLKGLVDFKEHLSSLGIELPLVSDSRSSKGAAVEAGPGRTAELLGQPYTLSSGRRIGNRFAALPMEGWDGTVDGRPGELTFRRWRRFGESGAKLIWGGEAAAVRYDGRANPNQLLLNDTTAGDIETLRKSLAAVHKERFGNTDDLFIGLQLTHSGRFSRPNDNSRLEPKIAYRHPILDKLFNLPPDHPVMTDTELDDLIGDFVRAAVRAGDIGFDFVDVKLCHGYLGHELLSARTRTGRYGGSFENRSRFARDIITGIRRDAPRLEIGVRLSIFDFPPFSADGTGTGRPKHFGRDYPYAFGADPADPLTIDLTEVKALIKTLGNLGVELICTTAGSPYYNPHIQRPALFPPSDGYNPPEDPLIGTARQIRATAELKARFPDTAFTGAAYSYLQEWLPNVAAGVIREGMADFIGLGRMMFSYPAMPADILGGKPLDRKRICRACSRCTTAPRKGHVSGCYLRDPLYAGRPEYLTWQRRESSESPHLYSPGY